MQKISVKCSKFVLYVIFCISLVAAYIFLFSAHVTVNAEIEVMQSPINVSVELTLSDSLRMNFYLPELEGASSENKPTAIFSTSEGDTSVTGTLCDDGGWMFRYSSIVPQNLDKSFDVRFELDGRIINVANADKLTDYSVIEYLNAVKSAPVTDAERTAIFKLVNDINNYGLAAKAFMEKDADFILPTDGTEYIEPVDGMSNRVDDESSARITGASVIFDSKVAVKYFLTDANCTLTVNGKTLEIENKDGDYYAIYGGINASELCDRLTATLKVGDKKIQTVEYGVYDYIARTLKSATATPYMKTLAKSLYCYGEGVKAYCLVAGSSAEIVISGTSYTDRQLENINIDNVAVSYSDNVFTLTALQNAEIGEIKTTNSADLVLEGGILNINAKNTAITCDGELKVNCKLNIYCAENAIECRNCFTALENSEINLERTVKLENGLADVAKSAVTLVDGGSFVLDGKITVKHFESVFESGGAESTLVCENPSEGIFAVCCNSVYCDDLNYDYLITHNNSCNCCADCGKRLPCLDGYCTFNLQLIDNGGTYNPTLTQTGLLTYCCDNPVCEKKQSTELPVLELSSYTKTTDSFGETCQFTHITTGYTFQAPVSYFEILNGDIKDIYDVVFGEVEACGIYVTYEPQTDTFVFEVPKSGISTEVISVYGSANLTITGGALTVIGLGKNDGITLESGDLTVDGCLLTVEKLDGATLDSAALNVGGEIILKNGARIEITNYSVGMRADNAAMTATVKGTGEFTFNSDVRRAAISSANSNINFIFEGVGDGLTVKSNGVTYDALTFVGRVNLIADGDDFASVKTVYIAEGAYAYAMGANAVFNFVGGTENKLTVDGALYVEGVYMAVIASDGYGVELNISGSVGGYTSSGELFGLDATVVDGREFGAYYFSYGKYYHLNNDAKLFADTYIEGLEISYKNSTYTVNVIGKVTLKSLSLYALDEPCVICITENTVIQGDGTLIISNNSADIIRMYADLTFAGNVRVEISRKAYDCTAINIQGGVLRTDASFNGSVAISNFNYAVACVADNNCEVDESKFEITNCVLGFATTW